MIQPIRSFILCTTYAEIAEIPANRQSVLCYCEETRRWYRKVHGTWTLTSIMLPDWSDLQGDAPDGFSGGAVSFNDLEDVPSDFPPSTHSHDYAASSHHHDAAYSAIAHHHNASYSAIGHNHDASYSALAHNHDGVYSPVAHSHPISYVNGTLGADVTMTNGNTFYVGASVSLVAGTWLVTGHITTGRTTTTLQRYTGRLRNTTASTNLASTQMTQPSQNPHYVNMALSAIVVLAETSTIQIQAAATSTACVIKAAAADNGSGNNATQVNAIRLA